VIQDRIRAFRSETTWSALRNVTSRRWAMKMLRLRPMQHFRLLLVCAGFALVLMCLAAAPSFQIVPLETVSETSSNASIGNLNGDGVG